MSVLQFKDVVVDILDDRLVLSNIDLVDFTTVIAHKTTLSPASYTRFDEETFVLTLNLTTSITLQSRLIPSHQIKRITTHFSISEDKSVTLYF